MNEKHTPGPWFRGNCDSACYVYDKRVWINQDGSRGGDTPNMVVSVTSSSAVEDANLIAAAPDLLAALIALDEAYCRAGEDLTRAEKNVDRICLVNARAAIAKARGIEK